MPPFSGVGHEYYGFPSCGGHLTSIKILSAVGVINPMCHKLNVVDNIVRLRKLIVHWSHQWRTCKVIGSSLNPECLCRVHWALNSGSKVLNSTYDASHGVTPGGLHHRRTEGFHSFWCAVYFILSVLFNDCELLRWCSICVDKGMSMEHWWHYTDGETEVVGEKPVPLPLCPPQVAFDCLW
jgi:hypothetical protein